MKICFINFRNQARTYIDKFLIILTNVNTNIDDDDEICDPFFVFFRDLKILKTFPSSFSL